MNKNIKGAGRKKLPKGEKKVSVTTYHRPCDLVVLGSNLPEAMDTARSVALAAIERKIYKILNA